LGKKRNRKNEKEKKRKRKKEKEREREREEMINDIKSSVGLNNTFRLEPNIHQGSV
jgi:hypothetical protein